MTYGPKANMAKRMTAASAARNMTYVVLFGPRICQFGTYNSIKEKLQFLTDNPIGTIWYLSPFSNTIKRQGKLTEEVTQQLKSLLDYIE